MPKCAVHVSMLVAVCLLRNALREQLQWLARVCYLVEDQNAMHWIAVNGSAFKAHAFVLSLFRGPICAGSKLSGIWRIKKTKDKTLYWVIELNQKQYESSEILNLSPPDKSRQFWQHWSKAIRYSYSLLWCTELFSICYVH